MYYLSQITRSEQKKLINYFCKLTNKPDENLIGGRDVGETLGVVSSLTPWLIGIKYPKNLIIIDI